MCHPRLPLPIPPPVELHGAALWKRSSGAAGQGSGGETASVAHANTNRPRWLEADRGAACWSVASVCCSTPGRRKTEGKTDRLTGWCLPATVARTGSVCVCVFYWGSHQSDKLQPSLTAAAAAAAGTSVRVNTLPAPVQMAAGWRQSWN